MMQRQHQQQLQRQWKISPSSSYTILYILFLLFNLISCTNGFITTTTTRRPYLTIQLEHPLIATQRSSSLSMMFDSSSNNNNDDYFSSFLSPSSSSSTTPQCTHLIAIPLSSTHDLLSTLESIQRSILQECPFLIKAVIVPIVTRMPLLCVNGRDENGQMVDRGYVTQKLGEIVSEVVEEFIFVQGGDDLNEIQKNENEEKEEAEESMGGVNSDGIKPLLMSFRGLELDGDDNSALFAIGEEDCDGTKLLRSVITEIQRKIEENYGWKTFYPPENPQEKVLPKFVEQEEEFLDRTDDSEENEERMWRPRVPFMRLPPNFEESLPIPEKLDDDFSYQYRIYEEDGVTKYIRTPEQGGNGISPLFWYPWINDELTTAPEGTRLRSIAIYGRTGPSVGITENSFYIPHKSIDLPEGNELLQKSELEDEKIDEEKYKGMGLEDDDMIPPPDFTGVDEEEYRTEMDREQLERIYAKKDVGELQNLLSSLQKENKDLVDDESMILDSADFPPGEIIEATTKSKKDDKTSASQEKDEQSESPKSEIEQLKESSKTRKNLPPPEENPILMKFRQNRDNYNPTLAADTPTPESKSQHPFPHSDYFVGVWRLVSSPLSGGNEFLEDGSESSDCDNLILRVDGTIAGGPVLDSEDKHKAAGGMWNMFRAVWTGGDGDKKEKEQVKKEQVRLRIQLIVPPERTKVVVMEGEVTRGMMMMMGGSVDEDDYDDKSTLFASSTFGIPEVENVKRASLQKNKEEDLLHCGGEVWVEDYYETEREREEAAADGRRRRRKKLGMFSLMKLKAPNRDTLRYTVPIPRGFGGGGGDDGDGDGEGGDE